MIYDTNMFIASLLTRSAFAPILVHEPIFLRNPAVGDHKEWAQLRTQSRHHLTAWEQDWVPELLHISAYRRRLRIFEREARRASGLSLFIFRCEDLALIGGVTLTNIRYGAARAGALGYWVGDPYLRRGYAAAAIAALLAHAIDALDLNRIEAACQKGNIASQRLLASEGFMLEGCASDYLKINGQWRDHDLYAITARQYKERNVEQ